ncbi:hypothetical protein J4573_31400 [Actinomadura barringtoniae]|uniref:Cyanobacterial TRADD-N associated 2 transmembrane domain-containing protein n=1 Tax=Actinomadura barringtoniae TaxID=1427535 RepID=A0A939PG33_9ACTN|nr:hypothetical protein [Actinomadura barringtoniae]MBO2451633.1 hypothetical protein [Actinomadura barringtoniae]
MRRWIAGQIDAIIAFGLAAAVAATALWWDDAETGYVLASAGLALSGLMATVVLRRRTRVEDERLREVQRDLQEAESELTAQEDLALPTLWGVTHKRLDYYHQIATSQARQSFRNAQAAMGIGFVLLVVFAVLAFNAKTTAASAVTGALGATAAAFAAYIGRTFVRSQETAATHLRSYFDQPLEFSRYLAAERLLNGIDRLEPEQRATITSDLLRGIIAPPTTPTPSNEPPRANDASS